MYILMYMYILRTLKCSNIRMLWFYVLCNDMHMMHHCDLKHLNLHLFFIFLGFLKYYFNSPDLSNKSSF